MKKLTIFGILIALMMTFVLLPVANVKADDTLSNACLEFEFPNEDQKLAVGDLNNLTDVEKTKLDEYVTAFYDSFGCDTNTISFIKYQAADTNAGVAPEVHVVFVDDSFHKWEASELMKSTGETMPVSNDQQDAEKQNFDDVEKVNKAELQALVDQAKRVIANPGPESDECLEQLKALMPEAEALLANEQATQEQVDAMSAKIKTILEIDGCVPVTADISMLPMLALLISSGSGVVYFGKKSKK